MLLEYNEDTNEETIHNRAIELRKRVASRKLNESIKDGSVGAEEMIHYKQMSREERKNHLDDYLSFDQVNVKERMAVARAQQQLEAESKVRLLERDINRASRLGKSKLDTLTDLERRIKTMRQKLQDPRQKLVEIEIDGDLRVNDKQKLEKQFGQCPYCSRRILSQLLETHKPRCQYQEGKDGRIQKVETPPVYTITQTPITAIATFPPTTSTPLLPPI